jgi:FSR family fosmidomycin resistance protein-like MFS transporter
MAGVGTAALGRLADATSIDYVYQICAFLPLIGLLTVLLPNLNRPMALAATKAPAPG